MTIEEYETKHEKFLREFKKMLENHLSETEEENKVDDEK
jgi:hypothetical protein